MLARLAEVRSWSSFFASLRFLDAEGAPPFLIDHTGDTLTFATEMSEAEFTRRSPRVLLASPALSLSWAPGRIRVSRV